MEQVILAQIDVMYPVAVSWTRSRRRAEDIIERAVMIALANKESLLQTQRSVKSAMLALLRSIYVEIYQEQPS